MIPKWKIELFIQGPINLDEDFIEFVSRKDIQYKEHPLYSNIILYQDRPRFRDRSSAMINATVNAYAETSDLANKAALLFVGLALDVLSFNTVCPSQVSLRSNKFNPSEYEYTTFRITSIDDWKNAFNEARLLLFTEPTFLRSLSWYRKGLCSEDPLDRFLAFWNSIEVVAGKYHIVNEKTKSGIKNQIWQCFVDTWGDISTWKIIANQDKWIEENYNIRKDIAHGLISIDIESIENITAKLPIIEKFAHAFISDWRKNKLNPESKITAEIDSRLTDKQWFKIE